MKRYEIKRYGLYFSIFLFLVSLDLVFKSLFTININQGSLFGILQINNFWISLSCLAILIILLNLTKFKHVINPIIILAGIFGNLIDRVFYSGVRDFIQIGNFQTFNLADSYIFIGTIFLIYTYIKNDRI